VVEQPFADLPRAPAEHFKLCFYGAVLYVLEHAAASFGSVERALEYFPFLAGYWAELSARGLDGSALPEAHVRWSSGVRDWEATTAGHLPLRALREATGLDDAALTLVLAVGLVEEDARFGLLFEAMHGVSGQRRPTVGVLTAWSGDGARMTLRRLGELGLLHVTNPDDPRPEWALQVPGLVWDALRGEVPARPAAWAHYRPRGSLTSLQDYVGPAAVRKTLASLPELLVRGDAQTVVVRGPRHNGRRTALGALAHALGQGVLELGDAAGADEARWQVSGLVSTLVNALPILALELDPGETFSVPRLPAYAGPLGVVLGRYGGISGPGAENAIGLTLTMPDASGRRQHWEHHLGARAADGLDAICARFRLSGGTIGRAAGLAGVRAMLAGRTAINPDDVREASRALNRQGLDSLAEPVATSGGWGQLAVGKETLSELRTLESRCQYREQLETAVGEALGQQLNAGVRALFSGPSGTGKTLAARTLASVLGKDLYRLDLSAVVNKYIGETEKNLNRVLARAEELDVILLLDEGDALLTGRTNVQTSNDRYANLETNYLLQRLESFEGILIVTTNAGDRIDSAFERRFDVVVTFRSPDVDERWAIWQLHLPRTHAVEPAALEEVTRRCELRGGQIRNAVLHAALLALADGGLVTSDHLDAAVRREYRKTGAVSPLRWGSPPG
jgi:ATPase family associated with various cellular activities (AAA)